MIADANSFFWWQWVVDRQATVRDAVLAHIQQTLIAVVVGFAISIVLAAIALRWNWTVRPITWTAALIYTIPSLALFTVLIPITGLTLLTAEIALVGYTLLNLVPTIIAGLQNVPADALDAADGMGMNRRRRFLTVELPLAAPQIIAGLRIATVSTVGLVTISSFVALGGGVGRFITDGRARDFSTPIVLGVGLSILLAVAFDLVFVAAEHWATPWVRSRDGGRRG